MDQFIVFDKHLTKADLLVLQNLTEDVKEHSDHSQRLEKSDKNGNFVSNGNGTLTNGISK